MKSNSWVCSHRSLSSSSGGGKNGEGEESSPQSKTGLEEESSFAHQCNLQTSHFCQTAINTSERPDGKYEEELNSEEDYEHREERAMYQQQDVREVEIGEEPEDLTSSIERLRRFDFLSHINRVTQCHRSWGYRKQCKKLNVCTVKKIWYFAALLFSKKTVESPRWDFPRLSTTLT